MRSLLPKVTAARNANLCPLPDDLLKARTVMDGVVEQVGQGGLGEKTFLYVVVTVHSQRELPAHHQGE